MGPGNRPLDMEWLEDFQALAQCGNFSRAAEARVIAQPAFSRHIRALEEWVGVDLIDRSTHPVELTAAGARFLPLVNEVLAGLEAARIKARAAHEQAEASLRFAVTHVLSLYFFPGWLASLEGQLRFGPVQTMSDSSQACEDMMLQRRVQFVLCYGHPEVPGRLDEAPYPMTVLGDDLLLPVTAPNPQGQPLYTLAPGQLLPLLGYSDASGLGRILRRRLRPLFGPPAAGHSPAYTASVVFSAHNAVLLKAMALQGKGVAWLPRSLVADELRQQRLLPCGGTEADTDWQLHIQIRLYRQPTPLAPVAEQLWRACGGA